MPRHPFKAEISDAIREFAKLDDSYVTEFSYQTNTKKVWISLIKDGKAIEKSVSPEPDGLIRQIGAILRLAKQKAIEDKKLAEYIDTSVVLPDKPDLPPSNDGQTR